MAFTRKKNKSRTPLHVFIKLAKTSYDGTTWLSLSTIVRRVIDAGVCIHQQDASGFTALNHLLSKVWCLIFVKKGSVIFVQLYSYSYYVEEFDVCPTLAQCGNIGAVPFLVTTNIN